MSSFYLYAIMHSDRRKDQSLSITIAVAVVLELAPDEFPQASVHILVGNCSTRSSDQFVKIASFVFSK